MTKQLLSHSRWKLGSRGICRAKLLLDTRLWLGNDKVTPGMPWKWANYLINLSFPGFPSSKTEIDPSAAPATK